MAPENSWRIALGEDGTVSWSARGDEPWRREPETGWWERFKSGLIASFPLEKYL
jgi:hypothetical protein